MRKFNFKKVLFGLSVSLVLAMAIGSFALGEAQTPVTPQVAVTNDEDTGAFNVTTSGEYGEDADYHYEAVADKDFGVLYIHPQSSDTKFEIKNKDPETETKDSIEITAGPEDAKNAVNITLGGVNINTEGETSDESNNAPALKIKDDATFNVNITLANNSKNFLTSYYSGAGLQKNGDGTGIGKLTIGAEDDSEKPGELTATGGNSAGIGGETSKNASNIKITGGVITAEGFGGAGIGGGSNGNGSNITISGGKVTATTEAVKNSAAIGGKLGSYIYITGGEVIADGDALNEVAGIGGYDGNHIYISGGIVTATGSVGIGGGGAGGGSGVASVIEISGGKVTATGWIGIGGCMGNATDIKITGGVVEATGTVCSAIGSWLGSSSGNELNGDAVLIASCADSSYEPLMGFDSGYAKGILFTQQGSDALWNDQVYGSSVKITSNVQDPDKTTDIDAKLPGNLTIGNGEEVTIGSEVTLTAAAGANLIVNSGGTLKNEGIINIDEDSLDCSGGGQITTLLKYDPQGGSFSGLDDAYQLYKDSSGAGKSYTNLPTEATNAIFNGWNKTADGTGAKLSESTVDLNLHQAYADMDYAVTFDSQGGSDVAGTTSKYNVKLTKPASDPTKKGYDFDGWYKEESCTTLWDFDKDKVQGDMTLYAGWTEKEKKPIKIDQPDNGTIVLDEDEATEGEEVGFTLTPDEGYELKEGSVKVTDEDGNEIPVTEKDGKYTFEMPDSEVTISAEFEQIPTPTPPGPEPQPTPPGPEPGPEPTPTPEPTPDPSVNPDGGEGSGASSKTSDPFMEGTAIALLGITATGAVILRKRK